MTDAAPPSTPLALAEEVFEGHHRGLKEIIESLQQAGSELAAKGWANDSGQAFHESLLKLQDFSLAHFADEEKFMDDLRYPARKDHAGQHAEFLTHIGEAAQQSRDVSHYDDWAQTLDYVKAWWEQHALKYDRDLADFLCRGGI